ncbi:MAG: hypothetical protein JWN66_4597 [Sphingomonas bacterium]|uniref:hypothetical protein n=1 Tax=Sphingomonas bacterium TaxID=1895847 RepID=UPI0026123463|nr:hypothetical protein [Sphingomonas bacterium]MDB5707481.1 hypothetical protein [Sphingomonas bacterium]
MRNLLLALSAASLAVPVSMAVPVGADASPRHYRGHSYHHHARTCRHSKGSAGLIAGGVGGALVGRSIFGHGLLGTAAGGVGGAFAGRAIDRTMTAKRRCR